MGSQDGLQNAPRSAQDGSKRLLKSNFFALENRLKFGLVLDPILVGFGLPKPPLQVEMVVRLDDLKLVFFSMIFGCCFGWLQDDPRGAQVAPRPPQEHLKRLQDGAKSAPGSPKRSPRDPRSRSTGLKTLQDRPKRLEKNTVTKTMVHINVADIAEIDKDKTILARVAIRKGRAGAGVPPWGRQSGARPGGARSRRVGS